ncbi:Ig-like domain-containing protein [Curtobacterium sp. MCLR17_036]|uniref:Ig-like domain-containing protein n=1 Tax=Curtobacterium sp. MCLR17_036 TaxID=2175620 RepID=UPI0024DF3EBA|nr:Ig-like domain-containing protein [Curtobacterium sp. MCLR17_036]WIE64311.1 Ig-like domain-containing protein [Curtobacterium sp. MCLR17_036]
MSSRTTSTAAAALLLALAPLAVPDMAAATTATVDAPSSDERPDEVDVESPEQPTDEPSGSLVPAAPEETAPPEVVETPAAPEVEPAPTPTATPSAEAAAPRTPSATATPDAVTPNETTIDVHVEGLADATGKAGDLFQSSIFNIKNESGFTIPSRTLDIHWTIDGPATFPTSPRPYSVANSGTANVANCTFTSPKQTDCIGANPQSMGTGGANYNHIRVPVRVDDTALPGDVVSVHGYFEPNAATDYVNSNPLTSSTWKITIPLTAAVIDAPNSPVGPTPTVTGTGVPGGTVDVTVGDRSPVEVPVGDDGTWSLPVTEALPHGPVTVTAVQQRNGFTAEPATATLDVDAVAPEAPIVDDPGTLTDPTGPITGRAEPGTTIIVRDADGTELGRGETDVDGDFSVTLDEPLAEGSHDLEVVAADRVGNESDSTPATAVVPDTTAPDAPTVARQDLATPTGPVRGKAEAGSTVIVRAEDGTELGRGEADENGDFAVELDSPLVEGDHDVEVVAQDDEGNTSDPTPVTVTAPDVTPPDAPISTTPEYLADGTGPFTGAAEAGSTVIVRDLDGKELGRAEADENGQFTVVLDERLSDGAHALEIVAEDASGNVSIPTPITVEVDEAAPNPPVVTGPTDLADGTGPITGTAEAGATVIVRDENGKELGRDTADEDGDFTIVLDEPLSEGEHELEVVAEDRVGNTSTVTPVTVDVDTEAPEKPVVTSPSDLADGTGPITGTAEAGATVIVRDEDGKELGRGTADDNGDFTIVLDEPLTEGEHKLEVVAEDKVGNTSRPTETTVDVDTEAPDKPIVTSPADLADGTGPITGTAEAGAIVIIRDEDGKELGRGTANDDGDFEIVLDEPLSEGEHKLEIVAEDKVGNTSKPTETTVNVDTEAPEKPVITSPTDLADGTGPITGTAEAGSTVIVRDEDGKELGRGTADDNGDFEIVLDEPLPEGEHAIEIVAEDKVGNTSKPTETTVDVDTEAPKAPVVTSPSDLADSTGPITGTAEAGSTVIIRDEDGKELGRGTANEEGDFEIVLDEPLTEGEHKLEVVAEDKVGNVSDPTKTKVDVDTEAPEKPVVTSPSDLADGTGPITGTAEAGSTVIVRDEDGTEVGRGTANENGDWTVELDQPLSEGDHKLEVVAQDKVGNESEPTETTVDIDTEAPEKPVVTSPSDLADGTGPITGTAEPGSTVIVRDQDGTELGRGTADDNGDWTVELDRPLTDGEHDLVVVVEDEVGNVSGPTETTVDVDTEAPSAPVLEAFDDIVDGTGVVRGTAEPGATVVICDANGREIGRGTADAEGHFAFRTTVPLEPGAHLLSVVAIDHVGNESPGSSMLVTLVPEQDGEDGGDALPEITTPVVTLPGTVAPPVGTGSVAATGTSDQRPARSTAHATSATADELAFTGVELGGWLAAALTALGLGAFLRLLGRRRRRDDVQH